MPKIVSLYLNCQDTPIFVPVSVYSRPNDSLSCLQAENSRPIVNELGKCTFCQVFTEVCLESHESQGGEVDAPDDSRRNVYPIVIVGM